MCVVSCEWIEDQLRIENVLEEIRAWLEESRNRDELIVLYLDVSSNLIRWKQEDALASAFESSLGTYLLRRNDTGSLVEQVRQNKRVVLVSRRSLQSAGDIYHYTSSPSTCSYPCCVDALFLNHRWTEYDIGVFCDKTGKMRSGMEKKAGKEDPENPFYTRIVTNQLRYGPLSKDFIPIPSPVNIHNGNAQDLYRVGVNTIATDYIDPVQMKDHVWAWSHTLNVSSLRDSYAEYCVVMKPNRTAWSLTLCRETHAVLCQHEKNPHLFVKGAVVSNPQLFLPLLHSVSSHVANASSLCPDGYVFSPPTTA